jgi:predicted membrane-bound spermidine synthase
MTPFKPDEISSSGVRSVGASRWWYGVVLFLTAAGALVLEIVAGRMVAPYVGMSLYTWTAVIAVVLAGLSVGHWVGGMLADGDRVRCARWLAGMLMLASVTAALSLVLIRVLSPFILGAGLGPLGGIVLLVFALFFLPSFFIGTVSPILTALAVRDAPGATGRIIGQMFAIGAVGSIAGTLAAGFLFLSWIGSIGTVLSVAAVYALLGVVFVFSARGATAAAMMVCFVAVAALVGVTGGVAGAFDKFCLAESDYYCVRVIDSSSETGRPSALMVLDHMGHGINDRDDPGALHSSYVALTDELLRRRFANDGSFSAYFIGGGAYTLPRAWLSQYPSAKVTVAEIDPMVTRVAQDRMWLTMGTGLHVIHADARATLRNMALTQRFDIVVGDAFRDISIPSHLVTREFAQEVAVRLTNRGFYVLTVIDEKTDPQFLYSTARTLSGAFETVEVWIDIEQRGDRVTYLVLAGKAATDVARIQGDKLWFRFPDNFLARGVEAAQVLTDDYAPVDRLMFQVLKIEP